MNKDKSKLKGFFRLQLVDKSDGKPKVVGDSGWRENTVTDTGIRDYLVKNLTGAGGQSVAYMGLGTGGAPNATDTSLNGEITDATNSRNAGAVSTSIVSSKTAQFTAEFNSNESFVTTSHNISNIGLFDSSATNAGSLFAGNTYASSSLATNQNVNATYQIRFS